MVRRMSLAGRAIMSVAILTFGMLIGAFSATAAEPGQQAGDAERGAGKIATCLACHGQDGNSLSAALGPKIAGQHPQYLARQLKLFKTGERANAIMAPMATGLSERDIADLSAYYAAQSAASGVTDDALAALGEAIYRAGNPQTGVPACQACHGPDGQGNPLAGYPTLTGQHAQYTETTVAAFRDGLVWGAEDHANAVMAGVAKNLTEVEIKAVSSYIEGLQTD